MDGLGVRGEPPADAGPPWWGPRGRRGQVRRPYRRGHRDTDGGAGTSAQTSPSDCDLVHVAFLPDDLRVRAEPFQLNRKHGVCLPHLLTLQGQNGGFLLFFGGASFSKCCLGTPGSERPVFVGDTAVTRLLRPPTGVRRLRDTPGHHYTAG